MNKINQKDRIFGFLEMLLTCLKYHNILIAFKIGIYYIKAKHKLTGKKEFQFFNFKIKFLNPQSVTNMLFELFGTNEYYFKSDKTNPVILDIGTNIGDSIFYFKWLYPASVIYAYEPHPEAYSLLVENVKNNSLSNVFTYNFALSNRDEKLSLYSDHNSTYDASTTIKNLANSRFNNNNEEDKIICQRISGVKEILNLDEIDLIKIDIEGSEGRLFSDIQSALVKTKQVILEYHFMTNTEENSFDHIINVLMENNFTPTVFGLYRNCNNLSNPNVFLVSAIKKNE